MGPRMTEGWRRYERVYDNDVETEVRDELAFHIGMRIEALRAAGMDEESARREAERRLGDLSRVIARCRGEGLQSVRNRRVREVSVLMWREAVRSLRGLLRRPLFFVAACTTLALGVGATTAVYSMVDAVLLAPLPYAAADRLVVIRTIDSDGEEKPLAREAKERLRAAAGGFDAIASYGRGSWVMNDGAGEPEEIDVIQIEHNLFDILGAPPALGTSFTDEHRAEGGRGRVALLSWPLWQRRFGGDPGVIGRTIELRDRPHEILGVMPAGFEFPVGNGTDVWVPLIYADIDDRLRFTPINDAVARLAPDATVGAAAAEATTIVAQVAATGTDAFGRPILDDDDAARAWSARVVSVREAMLVSDRALWLLLAAVAMLLVIACGNVGNLFLVRASERRAELAVRAALGGSRRDLALPAVVEVAIVCVVAAGLGLMLAYWAVALLAPLDPGGLPRWHGIAVNGRAWRVASLATAVAAFTCALAPALAAATVSPGDALRGASRGTDSSRRRRLRDGVIALEIGLVFVLLVGAGLLLRSFAAARAVDTGYEVESVVTARVVLPSSRYPRTGERTPTAFYDDVLRQLRAHPAVIAAGAVSAVPMSEGGTELTGRIVSPVTGRAAEDGRMLLATAGYFTTLAVPVRGRDFTASDVPGAPRVTILNEAMARHLFPGQDAVGQRFRHGPGEWEVVGVVPDVRYYGPEQDPAPTYYVPQPLFPWLPGMVFAVRSRGDATAFGRTLVDIIHEVDPALPVADVRTLAQNLSRVLARRRFDLLMLTGIAVTALALAAVGVFGVMAHAVAQQRQELGVRQALGARAADIVALVLRRALHITAVGLVAGAVVAAVGVRALRAVLFGIAPADPLTILLAGGTVIGVGVLAALAPARRAARVDPAITLRGG